MAIKTSTFSINGSTYTLDKVSGTNKLKKQIQMPTKSSFSQPDHAYAALLKIIDEAGNVTSVDKTHPVYGELMKIRVKEKVAPTISVAKPSAGAYITSHSVLIEFTVTDNDSGVNPDTVKMSINGLGATPTRTTVTGGYKYTYTATLDDGEHNIVINAQDNDGNVAAQKKVTFKVDTIPPELSVSNPPGVLVTNKNQLSIAGKTNDATSAPCNITVKLNGADQGAVTVSADGTFSKTVTLAKGANTIVVRSTDNAGKYTEITRTVTYDADAPVILSIEVTPNPVYAGEEITVTVEATD